MKSLLVFVLTVAVVSSLQICSPDFCEMLPNCEPQCGAGDTLVKENNCDCCGYCVNMEVVGESCTPSDLGPMDPDSKYYMCQTGYKCDPDTKKCVLKN
ncbi:hypothetical protein AVEN_249685-1 [Araneus ventricosus]|uniref:IGFBP N-terminal domain-containing protein n=1 Tax=Araneus ventricosus TaxID=182803 RepID=A0A4Y2F7R6_ARAVE|nr:hypothetical protein AVEN_249685-1 [Araneus ventricosus]